jgi:hypothetical protein
VHRDRDVLTRRGLTVGGVGADAVAGAGRVYARDVGAVDLAPERNAGAARHRERDRAVGRDPRRIVGGRASRG